MLGNGYCTRPPQLDCAFESICETCSYFQTSLEFRPTLQQHDDAADRDQAGRRQLFAGLMNRLDQDASGPSLMPFFSPFPVSSSSAGPEPALPTRA